MRAAIRRVSPADRLLLPRLAVWRSGLALLTVLAGVLAGCSSAETWRYEWQFYSFERERAAGERAKLAEVVQEVLVHERYYPESDSGLGDFTHDDAILVSEWNEEDAMVPQGSYSGTRTRVAVRMVNGIAHLRDRYPRDEFEARRLDAAYWEDPKGERVTVSLGIASKKELNTNMSYLPGEHRRAEWKAQGEDLRLVVLLFEKIRQRFNRVAHQPKPEPGGLSSRSERAYAANEQGASQRDEDPYAERTIGPGGGSSSSGLRFGTNRVAQ